MGKLKRRFSTIYSYIIMTMGVRSTVQVKTRSRIHAADKYDSGK